MHQRRVVMPPAAAAVVPEVSMMPGSTWRPLASMMASADG